MSGLNSFLLCTLQRLHRTGQAWVNIDPRDFLMSFMDGELPSLWVFLFICFGVKPSGVQVSLCSGITLLPVLKGPLASNPSWLRARRWPVCFTLSLTIHGLLVACLWLLPKTWPQAWSLPLKYESPVRDELSWGPEVLSKLIPVFIWLTSALESFYIHIVSLQGYIICFTTESAPFYILIQDNQRSEVMTGSSLCFWVWGRTEKSDPEEEEFGGPFVWGVLGPICF